MAEKGFKRKLSAILSADVKGYSKLMGDDERLLNKYFPIVIWEYQERTWHELSRMQH